MKTSCREYVRNRTAELGFLPIGVLKTGEIGVPETGGPRAGEAGETDRQDNAEDPKNCDDGLHPTPPRSGSGESARSESAP